MNNRVISLIGFKSVGKSTLGRLLAKSLGYPFIDTDRVLESVFYQKYNQQYSFSQIHKIIGELAFRKMEERVCYDLFRHEFCAVVALGGSTLLNPLLISYVKNKSIIINLMASRNTLLQRWKNNPPGFINNKSLVQEFDVYCAKREQVYRGNAHFNLVVDVLSNQFACKQIKEFLVEYNN